MEIKYEECWFVGRCGKVGSVLMQCLVEEHDYDYIAPIFFSTTQAGQAQAAPSLDGKTGVLQQANSFAA